MTVPETLHARATHAERHPELRLTIDHVGLRRFTRGPDVFEDLPKVCALAKYPNVAVKASGVPSLSNQSYPYRDVQPFMKTLFDAFGPKRMFWGTDLTRMRCTYYECIHIFTDDLPGLIRGDIVGVIGRGG